MNEDSVAGLLRAETDVAPASRVDLDRVLHDGRRRRRRRALVGPVIAAVATALITLGATAVTFGQPAPGVDPDIAAPTAFDPLRLRFAVDWRPPALDAGTLTLGPDLQQFSYTDSVDRAPIASVTLYAAGHTPPKAESSTVVVHAADPVQGAPARWYVSGGQTDGLAWKWARDAWAVVTLDRASDPAGNRGLLRRIASSVRTDLDQSVRPPYLVDTPPGARLERVVFGTYESVGYTATYGFPDDPGSAVSVQVGPHNNDYPPNRVIGGRPGRIAITTVTYQVWLYQPTYLVTVLVRGDGGLANVPGETANAIALSVQTERDPTMVD